MKHLVTTALACSIISMASAIEVAVPNANALQPADSNNGIPFACSLQNSRVQQVYASSQFSFLGTNGGFINQIAFRLHTGPARTPVKYPLSINLSTTFRPVDGLVARLDDNVGPDSTTVFSQTFQFTPIPGRSFNMKIPFTTPFFYNPTNGNLLVDIKVGFIDLYYTSGATLEAAGASGDPISRVWALGSYGVNTPTSTNGTPDTYGLVTQFDISPVFPPPLTLALTRVSPTNFVISGANGVPGGTYSVLSAMSFTTPLTNWAPSAALPFDLAGGLLFTNSPPPNSPGKFYVIEIH